MSLSFLGKKSFHPSNPKNVAKLFEAEQKLAHEAKRSEELKHEAEQEAARQHARKLLGGAAGKDDPNPAMAFMYQKPPGMAEAQNRADRKKREDVEKTKAEIDAERFPQLKHAPREGKYTEDIEVTHKPFGERLRKVQCRRCQQWGHSLGDRECPLRDQVDEKVEEAKAREDPLGRAAGAEASGAALRWAPKNAPDVGMHGGASATDDNQQFLPMADEEEMAMAAAAAGGQGGANMEDLDPAVLALLSDKQRKKLLKMYQKELAHIEGGRGGDGDGGDGGAGHKRKKHHKESDREKKESKREHKHTSKKHKHKHTSKRDDNSGSGSNSEDDRG